jgi:hypothetical protein
MIIKKIQKINTKDGFMVPVYRDWDKETNEGHVPKMVYTTYLNPGVEKDIILHKNRKTYITCIYGKVKVQIFKNNNIIEKELNFDDNENFIDLLIIDPNIPIKYKNISNNVSILLNCPSPSWHPKNEDTYKAKNWKDIKEVL